MQKNLPTKPGVYIFKDRNEEILYIGKAKNIRKRVKDHYSKKEYPDNIVTPKTKNIDYIITSSERHALILENELIKKYQPKYNRLWKDDKSYPYVSISNHDFPIVSTTHQRKNKGYTYIGPFTSSKELKKTLNTLRKILPFRTCKTFPKKPCLYYDLELCKGYCISKTKKEYDLILKTLIPLLLVYVNKKPRIEGYDISNTQGTNSVGSMVVFKGKDRSKKDYRLFKIKTKGINDSKSMKEIIQRRLKHNEWDMPDLIIVDGGKTQLAHLKNIPVLAMSKLERRYDNGFIHSKFTKKQIEIKKLPKEIQEIFFRVRNESHRFAITFHKKLRLKHAI